MLIEGTVITLKIFIAGRTIDVERIQSLAADLIALGHDISSRWIFLPKINVNSNPGARLERSLLNQADVGKSDVVVFYNLDGSTDDLGEGRFECGYAMGKNIATILLGPRESIFEWHPGFEVASTVDNLAYILKSMSPKEVDPDRIDSYQDWTRIPAKYPHVGSGNTNAFIYNLMGLGGEVGEVIKAVLPHLSCVDADTNESFRYLVSVLTESFKALDRLEKFKKEVRDGRVVLPELASFSEVAVQNIVSEMSDVGWYWPRAIAELKLKASYVIKYNVEKLTGRMKRNTIIGSGDNR